MAGGHVPWWLWGLLVWSTVAVLLGIALGLVVRAAERREVGGDRPLEDRGTERRLQGS